MHGTGGTCGDKHRLGSTRGREAKGVGVFTGVGGTPQMLARSGHYPVNALIYIYICLYIYIYVYTRSHPLAHARPAPTASPRAVPGSDQQQHPKTPSDQIPLKKKNIGARCHEPGPGPTPALPLSVLRGRRPVPVPVPLAAEHPGLAHSRSPSSLLPGKEQRFGVSRALGTVLIGMRWPRGDWSPRGHRAPSVRAARGGPAG